LQLFHFTAAGPIKPASWQRSFSGENIMADNIREKIEDVGQAAKDTANQAGDKLKKGANEVADRAANAANSAGQKLKDAGQKLKDKSGS
jgi:hypothetical protein